MGAAGLFMGLLATVLDEEPLIKLLGGHKQRSHIDIKAVTYLYVISDFSFHVNGLLLYGAEAMYCIIFYTFIEYLYYTNSV